MIFEMTKLQYHGDLANFVKTRNDQSAQKHTIWSILNTQQKVSSCYLICPNTMIITPSASP